MFHREWLCIVCGRWERETSYNCGSCTSPRNPDNRWINKARKLGYEIIDLKHIA